MASKPVSMTEVEEYAVKALKKWLKKALSVSQIKRRLAPAKSEHYSVDLSICGAPKMKEINTAFRKVKAPTDILSFPTHEFFQKQGMLGDLVLCAPVAIKQAKSVGHNWKKEVDVLLVHGILHLCHFDHEESDREAKLMSGMELKILGKTYKKSLIQRSL